MSKRYVDMAYYEHVFAAIFRDYFNRYFKLEMTHKHYLSESRDRFKLIAGSLDCDNGKVLLRYCKEYSKEEIERLHDIEEKRLEIDGKGMNRVEAGIVIIEICAYKTILYAMKDNRIVEKES